MNGAADLDGSLLAPPVDKTLTSADRLAAVRSVLQDMNTPGADSGRQTTAMTMFDAKEQYKALCRCCAIAPRCSTQYVDPKVACWLLDPSSSEKNLHCLVTNFCPLDADLLHGPTFFLAYLTLPCRPLFLLF